MAQRLARGPLRLLVQVTSEQEIVAIEQALALPDSLKPDREHLNQSLTLLFDRKMPDYRNSIKEIDIGGRSPQHNNLETI
jgi:hypothetical protein